MTTSATATVVQSDLLIEDGAQAALSLLLEAARAGEQQADAWQFALGLSQLLGGGLTPTALRLLLTRELLEQRTETSAATSRQRTFLPVQHLGLGANCCFLLTAAGVALANLSLKDATAGGRTDDTVTRVAAVRPHWSARSGRLSWQELLVRRVPRFALNLRLALDCLEEDKWPLHGVDNPFAPKTKGDAQRLVETVGYLNQHQFQARIVFSVDDSRTRLLWRAPTVASPADNGKPAAARQPKKCGGQRRKK